MEFDIKQVAGNSFMVGLTAASFIWVFFGWALSAFHYAPVFKSINEYGFAKWLASDLPFMAPLILFWFIILFILALLWLVCFGGRTISLLKNFATQPIKNGVMCAVYIIIGLLLIGHAVDMATTTRVKNVVIAKEGTATFKSGLEITLAEIDYTNGEQYLNLPLNAERNTILRNDWNLTTNTALIGIKPPNGGVVYDLAFMTKPIGHNGINVIIEKFYSSEGALSAAGVSVTMSKKPLMPVLIVLYLLLALSILGVMLAPKLERIAHPKAEAAPAKLPAKISGGGSIAKAKKKNKKH